MAGEEEDDGDDGDKKAKPQSELFQVIRVSMRVDKKFLTILNESSDATKWLRIETVFIKNHLVG